MTDVFDLGIGTLYPFLGKSERDKHMMIHAMGPPSSGGVTLGRILRVWQQFDVAALRCHGADHLMLMAEASKRCWQRLRYPKFTRQMKDQSEWVWALRDVDITTATQTLAGMVLWLPKWYRQTGRLSAQQMANEITKLAIKEAIDHPGKLSNDVSAGH